jgi:hypothetical protein
MLEASERRALILHELAHIRRKDQLIRWLESLACILFFFFPPVRWVCRRVEHFTEMACDRWAVAVSRVEPQAYAEALVRVVKEMRSLPQAQAGMPLVRGVRLMEERLRTILRDDATKSPRLSPGAKVVLIGWSLFVLAGGSAAEARKETPNLPEMSASQAEEVSSEGTRAKKDESQVALTDVGLKREAERAAAASKQTASSELRQIKTSPYADQEQQSLEKTDYSRDERIAAERRARESRSEQGTMPPSESKALSPYEEGFLLGSRFAEERARWSHADPATDGQTKRNPQSLDELTKREIEKRMQGLTTQPPRQ